MRDPAGGDSEPPRGRDAAHTPANTSTQVKTHAPQTATSRDEESAGVRRRRAPATTRSTNQHNDAARTTLCPEQPKRLTSSRPPSSTASALSANVAATRLRGSGNSCDPTRTPRRAQDAGGPVEQTCRT